MYVCMITASVYNQCYTCMFVLFCQSGIRSLDVTVHNSVSVNDLPSSHPDYFLFCLHLQDISVPDIVPAEYRDVSKPLQTSDNRNAHPLTGSERRYVLGDRFLNSSNPHKSHLCQFHDINLCLQSCVLKTSYQESENHRKNIRRLRSSCVQGFGTHFFYNCLMDFYQNETIVRKQRTLLEKNLANGQFVSRDQFSRFQVSNAQSSH